ncbi:hypothetical protein P3S51_02165 [Acinetobacter sp. ANC 7201]|uniref:hypothetical protein n=1 Tax=Acinetobacter sp. ANC 7201 TaxID=3035288 RepID=UPI00279ECA77|nr:hypothetical protein [Acinetobacter sp. ANC 7201]WFP97184.1 hypothetical protein P3S51_02165 [Acinetobacter sp. ANC 7201]
MPLTLKNNTEIFEQIFEIANQFDPKQENYLLAYSYFVSYFQQKDTLALEHIVIGISFTYSWMPTILKTINLSEPDQLILIFNKVKQGHLISTQELQILKNAFNNSLVGVSKLLHFIQPEKYAIWDSRVFRFLSGNEPHVSIFKQPETYLSYLTLLDNLKNEPAFSKFYRLMQQKVDYPISEYRALELAFFKGG